MLKDKQLTSLHDSLFAKFKDYELSKEQMRQVRGGVEPCKTQTQKGCTTCHNCTNGYSSVTFPSSETDSIIAAFEEGGCTHCTEYV